MFALRMPDVNRVQSYDQAVSLYAKATPRKVTEGKAGTHFMPGHKSAMTGLTKLGNGDIAFTYHSTDVVVWHSDGSITLDLSYRSISTANFANRFVPRTVNIYGEANHISINSGSRHYIAAEIVRITPNGEIEKPGVHTIPIVETRYDRKATKAVLDSAGYPEFRKWYLHMRQFLTDKQSHRNSNYDGIETIESAVRDPDQWDKLINTTRFNAGWRGFNVPTPEGFLTSVREAIYENHDVQVMVEHEYAPSWRQFDNWRK